MKVKLKSIEQLEKEGWFFDSGFWLNNEYPTIPDHLVGFLGKEIISDGVPAYLVKAKEHLQEYLKKELYECTHANFNGVNLYARAKPTGGSSDYYKLPDDATQLQDLIEVKNMNGNIKDIFKACYRYGQKDGTTDEYDARKMVYYSLRELGRITGSKDYIALAESVIGDQCKKEMNEQ